MPTGDGLLARIVTTGSTIGFRTWAGLCAAARVHGNGIIEITARGSIQVRGLSPASAPDFARSVAALGIASCGLPLLIDPLAGLDPDARIDATALAGELRSRLARTAWAASLGPKVSVVIDAGVSLHLDAVAADVRLHADRAGNLALALGGDATTATPLGAVEPRHACEAALRLLEIIATAGPAVRARDLVSAPDRIKDLQAALAGLLKPMPALAARQRAEPIGRHLLHDGSLALGIGMAFGHTEAVALEALSIAADRAGGSGMRTAANRALLIVGLAPEAVDALAGQTEGLGFITRADDPRRSVVACAGAPICASAEIPARSLAPLISDAAASHLNGTWTVHVSGCPKGCAHPGPAALTIVGGAEGCGLVHNGTARDRPSAMVSTAALPDRVAGVAAEVAKASHA
jgi:precorrin-3B synthase